MFGDSLRSKQDKCFSLRGNVSSAAHLMYECLSLSIARWEQIWALRIWSAKFVKMAL